MIPYKMLAKVSLNVMILYELQDGLEPTTP